MRTLRLLVLFCLVVPLGCGLGNNRLDGRTRDLRQEAPGGEVGGQGPRPANNAGIEFAMKGKRWSEVFAWLTEQTDLPFVGSSISGQFTFVGRKGARYTLPQIVAIINQALLRQHNAYLVRRPRCFVLVWVAEPVLAQATAGPVR
jgi:hypothetical protein